MEKRTEEKKEGDKRWEKLKTIYTDGLKIMGLR